MFFNILATFAEFEVDLLRLRTRRHGRRPRKEGWQAARAYGPPAAELTHMHATGGYTIADLMEVFSVRRATVYRTLERISSVG